MNTKCMGPAVEMAVHFLDDSFEKKLWKPGTYLPSLQELARQSGVSRATMAKATKIWAKLGRVVAVKGKKLFVPATSRSETGFAAPGEQKWERLRRRIEQDILSGHFAPGSPLPFYQQLQNRYGICFATLKKALVALEQDRVIAIDKKRYRLPLPEPKRFP